MQMQGVEEFMPNKKNFKKKRNPFADPDAEDAKNDKDDSEDDDAALRRPLIKSFTDLQRLKLEKLMKNPEKPVIIPELPKEKDYLQTVPNFVRNVMGSSAGAGSGEFHVYRHLRRKEFARQKYMKLQTNKDQMDVEYQEKLERNRLNADEKTAKKRAKRLKKKQKQKQKGKKPKIDIMKNSGDELSDSESASEENEEEVKEKNVEIIVPEKEHKTDKVLEINQSSSNENCDIESAETDIKIQPQAEIELTENTNTEENSIN